MIETRSHFDVGKYAVGVMLISAHVVPVAPFRLEPVSSVRPRVLRHNRESLRFLRPPFDDLRMGRLEPHRNRGFITLYSFALR